MLDTGEAIAVGLAAFSIACFVMAGIIYILNRREPMYTTTREAAKEENVPYTVIQGWVRRGYVKSIRAGQSGDWRISGANGELVYHNLVNRLDVSSLAEQWRIDNPSKPSYITASQYKRFRRKASGN